MKIASSEIRKVAVKACLSGKVSKQQVADVLGYHLSAINRWIRAFKHDNRLSPQPRGHLNTAFSLKEREELAALIQEKPDITIYEIKMKFCKSCSNSSVHRAIVALGFRYKKNRYEPVNKNVMI
jgi:transposase